MRIYLHIGAGKCASSTLQEHFSYNSLQENFAYGHITANGSIMYGSSMQKEAAKCVDNCLTSRALFHNIKRVENFSQNLEESLKLCSKQFDILLLSCEAWHRQSKEFIQIAPLLKKYEVEIIFIVRPFVEWYNSAWWQWYNWDKDIKNVDDIIHPKHFKNNDWSMFYEEFASLSFVNKVHMLTLNENILEEIYTIINISYKNKEKKKSNVSSSAELLYFLSQNKHLRPMHAPFYEIILNKYLKKRTNTPWALSEKNISKLLEISHKSALNLAKNIKNENIINNPLWWEVSAYKEKHKHYYKDFILEEKTLLNMLEEAENICDNLIIEIQNAMKKIEKLDIKAYALCQENLLNLVNTKKEAEKSNHSSMQKLEQYYTIIIELDRFIKAIVYFI